MQCFVCIEQDEMGVYETCGKYSGELNPGCQFIGCAWFGCAYTVKKISMRLQENQTVVETKTKDNVFVHLKLAIQQQPRRDDIYAAVYRLRNVNRQIDAFVNDTVRAEVPLMTLDEVFADKDRIATQVKAHLIDDMTQYGYEILQSLVVQVEPDATVKEAMNAVEEAKRSKIAMETDALRDKNVAIKNAQAIAEAKALQGVGISRQRGTIVQGLKDSIGMGGGAADATKVSELLLITQYFDTLEKLAEGKGNVTFINQGESMSDMFRNGILQTARAGGK